MENMKITSSDPKDYQGISGKGLITSLGLNTYVTTKKTKKERYVITNVSMKNLSKIIKDFEKLPYKGYVRKSPKHEPTGSYFYLSRHLSKCMMRADALNFHVDPVKTEMDAIQKIMISHVCDSEESK